MTRTEQATFIHELCKNVKDELVLNTHKHPEEWDGNELRQLIADHFQACVMRKMTGKRMKEFKNTVLINNL